MAADEQRDEHILNDFVLPDNHFPYFALDGCMRLPEALQAGL
jgi:hypothetical protein